ncbi:MAG TPA: isochorismatase family protein [Capillimicrobium sp.]|jgi:nicotinamidase-related amidase
MTAPLLDRNRAALLVVDVQEGFRPVIDGFDEVARATSILVQGAQALRLPVVVTEQYPKGLGPTVDEVAAHLDGVPRLEKTAFPATEAAGFDLDGRDQVLICGIESHICVHQSAARLLEGGAEVQVVQDAVSARTPANREVGLRRVEEAGGRRTSVEMALFELLGAAGSDEFKTIQRLIK